MPTQPIDSDSRRSGFEASADDELGGPAADVDYESRPRRRRQLVRDAEVREPPFLVAADDVDRQAERALRERDERFGILGDSERVGRDDADRCGVEAREALAKAREARERRLHRRLREAALLVHAGAEAQRLAPGVELVDLVAFDAADLQPEAVGPEIEDRQQAIGLAFAHSRQNG
jgi:hypothetical protein